MRGKGKKPRGKMRRGCPLDTTVKKPIDPALKKALVALAPKMVDAHKPNVTLRAASEELPFGDFKTEVGGDWFGDVVITASDDTWSWQGATAVADYHRALVLGLDPQDLE